MHEFQGRAARFIFVAFPDVKIFRYLPENAHNLEVLYKLRTKKLTLVLSKITRIMTREEKFMQAAIDLSRRGVKHNDGGPFGCVIVKGDMIVGQGNNRVTSQNDPTAHAEVVAIRNACKNLETFQLDDCEIFTSCEPCPMCLGAIYWARPKAIYYANTREDAARIGFDDSMIYDEMNTPVSDRKIPIHKMEGDEALKVFEEWMKKTDKTAY